MAYSKKIESVMLLVFKEDSNLHQLIENAVCISRYFDAHILIGCEDSWVKKLEKAITYLKHHHRKFPLIQVCSVEGSFIDGSFREALEYGVDLLVLQGQVLHLSLKKMKLLGQGEIPTLILPYGNKIRPQSLKKLFKEVTFESIPELFIKESGRRLEAA